MADLRFDGSARFAFFDSEGGAFPTEDVHSSALPQELGLIAFGIQKRITHARIAKVDVKGDAARIQWD